MGYRIYLKIVKKEEVASLRACQTVAGLELLYQVDNSNSVSELFNGDGDYEFGKYIEWTGEQYQKYGSDILTTKELKEHYTDEELYEITGEGLLFIIEIYRKKVAEYYEDFSKILEDVIIGTEVKREDIGEVFSHIKNMSDEWNGVGYSQKPYNLNREKERTVNSYKYEYSIFELVRLYKKFDPETESIIIYGW